MEMIFEWDAQKASVNYKKHGILFEEATLVFDDPFAISIQDRFEKGEQRWQTIGTINGYTVLLVAHTTRLDDVEVIMVISARKAVKNERKRYEQHCSIQKK